jgi:GT2 family glycosyltransferase
MTAAPEVAVVVPATDGPPTLERCLGAVRASSEPPEELIVVTQPPGAGPAEARNRGAARAGAELLVFLDGDVEIHPDALARVRGAFASDRSLTALFGSYDDRPTDSGVVSQFRNLLHHHVHTSSPGEASTFWAGLGAIRRDAFLAAGGFDATRFPAPAIEDIELGLRLTEDGRRIVLDPLVRGTHLKRWSLAGFLRTDLLQRGIPWVRLQLERRSAPSALNLGWRHRLSALLSLGTAVALAARRPLAAGFSVFGLLALNRRFYALLERRGGVKLALAWLPLHVLHHLVSAVALVAGVTQHALSRDPGRPRAAGGSAPARPTPQA